MNYIDNRKINTTRGTGVGFCGLLFLVFLVLKLTHVIDWSWWWITAPLWGSLALIILIFIITLIALAIKDR